MIFAMTQVWISLDIVITTLSIILMYKWNNKLINKLFYIFCCCFIFCIKKKLKLKNDINNLEITTITTTATTTNGITATSLPTSQSPISKSDKMSNNEHNSD